MDRATVLALLLACGPPPDPGAAGATPDTESTPETDNPTDSDTNPAIDSDRDDDTDSPPDSDTDPQVQLPTDWGAGFVDISGTLLTDDAFAVFPGDRALLMDPDTPTGVWTDLDGDGVPEVLITNDLTSTANRLTDTRVFRWTPGGLERSRDLEATLPALTSGVVLAIDLDQDGRDELVQSDREAVFWSEGAGWGPGFQLPSDGRALWSRAAAPWDFDHDGRLDLLAGEVRCTTSVVPWLQEAPRQLTWRGDLLPPGPAATPDAVLPFTLPDDRTVFVVLGSACDPLQPHPGFLREQTPGSNTFEPTDLVPSDALFKLSPPWAGEPLTAWAPMGASVSDLDGDDIQDLLLSLGFPTITVLQGQPDGTFIDRTALANLTPPLGSWGGTSLTWSLAHPDLDQDGRPDVLLTVGDDGTSYHLADGYPVTTQAWRNNGGFTFVDVAKDVHFHLEGGWKTLAMADPDRDGDADVIVGGRGVLPRVLRNDIHTGNSGLSLRLHGTLSNSYGIGAEVEAEVDGLRRQSVRVGNEGNCGAGSQPVVFLGAGPQATVRTTRVRWPSGYVQEFDALATGTQHQLWEPPLLTVSARTTRVGQAVEIRLLPHQIDGTPDPNASVSLTVEAPAALIDGPAWDGAAWIAHITSETQATAALHATFDGTPLRVHPRLTWTP